MCRRHLIITSVACYTLHTTFALACDLPQPCIIHTSGPPAEISSRSTFGRIACSQLEDCWSSWHLGKAAVKLACLVAVVLMLASLKLLSTYVFNVVWMRMWLM